MKHIASVSFGKDSLAMLLCLIEKKYPLDIVLFYNTGMEFEAIYRIRDKIVPVLEELGIDYVELHPSEPFLYTMLERPVNSMRGGAEVRIWLVRWSLPLGNVRKTQSNNEV